MPVREFRDETGRQWRAWDIRPESIHPITKAEDYLADCYVTGWIVFETADGREKRRLCPWPIRWMSESDDGLCKLLQQAVEVPGYRVRADREVVEQAPVVPVTEADASDADVTDLQVVRTFRYPGGRYWTVCVIMLPEDGGPPVLRFASGMRYLDIRRWPKDWADQPDNDLVAMLRRSFPRSNRAQLADGAPRRRWDDQPIAMA